MTCTHKKAREEVFFAFRYQTPGMAESARKPMAGVPFKQVGHLRPMTQLNATSAVSKDHVTILVLVTILIMPLQKQKNYGHNDFSS